MSDCSRGYARDVAYPSERVRSPPVSGSTDGLVGIHLMWPIRLPSTTAATAPLFATIEGRFNGRGTDDYRVGDELQVSVGGTYPVGERIDLLSQLNLRVRGKDDV